MISYFPFTALNYMNYDACSTWNAQFSGFYFKNFYMEKNSPARVKIEKSQKECLGNRLGSTHADNLASGLFCKFCCQQNFSPLRVKFEISQKEQGVKQG